MNSRWCLESLGIRGEVYRGETMVYVAPLRKWFIPTLPGVKRLFDCREAARWYIDGEPELTTTELTDEEEALVDIIVGDYFTPDVEPQVCVGQRGGAANG